MRLDKEGAFAHDRVEFLLSGIVYLLEMLVSFKTSEDFDITKIDEIITESPPRMVMPSKEDKKRREASDIERKNNINKTFMETLREVCVHSGRVKTLEDTSSKRGNATKTSPGGVSARPKGINRVKSATVRGRK